MTKGGSRLLPADTQVVSVDDHVIEHPRVWTDRLPAKYQEAGPRIVELDGGVAGVVASRAGSSRPSGSTPSPARTRRTSGSTRSASTTCCPAATTSPPASPTWTLDGVHVQMCFPSFPGFAGSTFLGARGQGPRRWPASRRGTTSSSTSGAAPHPDRFIPMVLVPFWDVDASVAEIERTAAKGAKAITFTEAPHRLGLPSFHTDHWDPLLAAAQDADMPLCMHFGTGGAPGRGPGRQLRGRDRAVRHELAVHDRRPAALAGVPQVPPPAGRAVRGRHRLDARTCSSGSTTPGSATAGTRA